MGIVKRQAFGNSVVQYAGVLIGFVNVTILFPNIFSADQFGLTRILVAIAAVYSQFSALGVNRTLIRFMPMFRTKDNKNNGLLLIGAIVPLVGFLLFTGLYVLFENLIIENYNEKSALFIDNYYLAIPFALFMLYTLVLEAYLMGMFRTVFSYFLRHVFIRLLWMADILLYHFGVVDWETFLLLFVLAYAVNLAVLAIYLMTRGGFNFAIPMRFKRRSLFRAMRTYGLYSMFSGISNFLVNRIDIIMITFITASGLNNAAIYAIAVYMASVIHVPAQAIARISFPLIADKWRTKDLEGISNIYAASARNQLILGGGIFVLIWANIDNIFQIMPPEYAVGKWALFFLGLAKLFDMASGVNGLIINATRFYRFDLYSSIFLLVLTVATNIWLITLYGIVGAAVATAFSVLLFNLMRFIYILVKLNLQPFNLKTLYTVLILVAVIYVQHFIPVMGDHYIIDLLIRSVIIMLLLSVPIYFLKLSEEINGVLDKMISRSN